MPRAASRTKTKQRPVRKGKTPVGTPLARRRIDLATACDVRRELCAVYREMRAKTIDASTGTKLAFVLAQIGKLIETHELEKRIEDLESRYKMEGRHGQPAAAH